MTVPTLQDLSELERVALGVIGAFFEIIIDWYLDSDRGDVATLIHDMTSLIAHLNAGLEQKGPPG